MTKSSPTARSPVISSGLNYALLAYVAWGLFPAYWKLLHHVPAWMVICHRVIWAGVFYLCILVAKNPKTVKATLKAGLKSFPVLAFSGGILSANWLVYVYAVNSGQIVEGSLGYFICPILSILLGVIFLGERLNRLQSFSVLLAAAGVAIMTFQSGHFPVIALFLAATFAGYGFIRKLVKLGPVEASVMESLIFSVPALITLFFFSHHLPQATTTDVHPMLTLTYLVLGGVVTGLPLLWYIEASRKLPFWMLGFCQFLAPTLQLSVGVLIYHEPFTQVHLMSFGAIWGGLVLFAADLYWRTTHSKR